MSHSRSSQRYQVWINGIIDSSMEVLKVQESKGARRLDHAIIQKDPAVQAKVQDYALPIGFDDEVEIVAVDALGVAVPQNPVKHWGRISQVLPIVGASGEIWKFVSRAEPFHFGDPLRGYFIYDPVADANQIIGEDLVFNPQIDGRVFGNKHPSRFIDVAENSSIFLDRESTRTTAAQTFQGGVAPEMWTLAEAIKYLAWALNPGEANVLNPFAVDLPGVFGASVDDVRNTVIKRGTYLPEALDQLLEPLGYLWRVEKFAVGVRNLTFAKKGSGGNLVWVNHQRFNTAFDPAETNTESSGIAFDGSSIINNLEIHGSPQEFEVTVELARGWPDSQDDTDADSLAKTSDGFDTVRNAYRRWVLNEAGDYIGLRPEITGLFTTAFSTALDGIGLLTAFQARRRKLLPTLTLNSNGTESIGNERGVQIEFLDYDGMTWKPVENWGCKILQQEAGIYIDSERVPEELLDQRANGKIRVTATLRADFPVFAVAAGGSSPLIETAGAILNMDGTFQLREVTSLSQYSGGGNPTLAVDDRTAMGTFAANLVDVFNQAEVSGPIALDGVDQHGYLPMDRVQGIQFRNVSFETRSGNGTFPQIVSVTYDIENQRTLIELQTFREFVA